MTKITHYLTLATSVITSVAAAVYGAVGSLPQSWQHPVLVGVGVAGVAATAVTAANVAVASAQMTHESKVAALPVLGPDTAIAWAHTDKPIPAAAAQVQEPEAENVPDDTTVANTLGV